MHRKRHTRSAPLNYRDRKDHLIDAQMLALHRQVAMKLQNNKALLNDAEALLCQRADSGRLSKGHLLSWLGLLDLLRQTGDIGAVLLEDSREMRRLLRVSPLVALLTEEERQQAVEQGSAGQCRADDLY